MVHLHVMQEYHSMRLKTYIREWRKHQNLSQEQVANAIGMSTPNLSRLERGLIPYSQTTLEALANLFEVQPADLLSPPGPGLKFVEGSNFSPGPEFNYLPLISWVQAGAWTEVEDPFEPGQYERLIPVTKRYSDRAYALTIEGDSMHAPDGVSFPSGSIIAVEPMREARNGSYVVAKLEDSQEATFKQLVFDGDRRYLKPLNPRYPIIEIAAPITICGVVRQLVMDFED